ncbi:hypothetical protein [Nocardioides sp. GXQ0305]|uniref:hypothetical protein n=1 Tax=Nocardioides sp. GXQ0305 TaxID=3423912 RepID=UPI003D7C411C
MGNKWSSAVVAAVMVAGLGAAASPAQAGDWTPGQKCVEYANGIEKCAGMMEYEGPVALAWAWVKDTDGTRLRVRTRVNEMQWQTDDGWRVVARRAMRRGFWPDAQGIDRSKECGQMPRGTYRSRAKIEWRRPGGRVHTTWITSYGVRKGEVC